MPKGERGPVGEVLFFPLDHPVKTVVRAGLGCVAFVGTVLGAQASMILAEHGAARRPELAELEVESYEQ